MKLKLVFSAFIVLLLVTSCAPSKCGDGKCSALEIRNKNCAIDCDKEKPVANNTVVEPEEKPVAKQGKFDFGVEYAPAGLADAYSDAGVHAAKPYPELVIWKNIQKSKDSGYDWSSVDAIVKEYQDAGFDKIQLLISAESSWASRDAAGLKPRDTRPKKEYEHDYANFVKAAVERYDHDGIDDMNGLRYAINDWGVEREFSPFFPGTASDYVEVLKVANAAIKEANPNAKVMLNALLMVNVFAGNPSDEEIKLRLNQQLIGSKSLSEIRTILDETDYYDVVDLHLLGDYSEIDSTARWVKNELKKKGVEKEIYGGDAFPMSPLLAYGLETCKLGLLAAKEIYPVNAETRCDAANVISAMRKSNDPNHEKAMEWLEKNIALNIPRKYAAAANAGLSGINIGNMEDWFIPVGAGTASNMGLIDTTLSGSIRKPGEKRPGFYALEMCIKYLDGFSDVRKLELGENIYAYEFTNNKEKVIVAWHDDGKFYGMDKETPRLNVEMSWSKNSARVVEVPVKRGEQEGKMQVVTASNGKIKIELGYIPVFIS